MSDYYQQEVTKFMMRRAARRPSDNTDTPVEDEPRRRGWLAGLRRLVVRSRTEPEMHSTAVRKSPKLAR